MTAIGRMVTAITGSPAPVLFVDSCTLLDIVRAPLRNKANEVRAARQFLASVRKAPKRIHLLLSSLTPQEWADHIDEAVADCTKAVNACNAVSSICGHLTLSAVATVPAAVLTLPDMLRNLSADLRGEAAGEAPPARPEQVGRLAGRAEETAQRHSPGPLRPHRSSCHPRPPAWQAPLAGSRHSYLTDTDPKIRDGQKLLKNEFFQRTDTVLTVDNPTTGAGEFTSGIHTQEFAREAR